MTDTTEQSSQENFRSRFDTASSQPERLSGVYEAIAVAPKIGATAMVLVNGSFNIE